MQGFNYYTEAWAVYIGLGLIFMFLLDLKLRQQSFNTRLAVLGFIAVAAFTPQQVTGSDSFAPLILVSLLNAEVNGINEIYKGLVKLLILWALVVSIGLAVRNFILAKRSKQSQAEPPHGGAPQNKFSNQPKQQG